MCPKKGKRVCSSIFNTGCLENIVPKPIFKHTVKNHLWPVFKQQNKGSKWQLGNYLENGKGPPGQVCLISSSHNYPKVSARQIPKSTWSAFFKNQTQIPNTYFCFLNTETCYLNYDTKHIFFIF